MKTVAVISLVSFLSCCAAFPVQLADNPDSVVGIPAYYENEDHFVNKREDPLPVAYVLVQKPGEASGSLVEKRSVKEDGQDLETAAGTYALRPLFVYRQQMAYRQRRRNRF